MPTKYKRVNKPLSCAECRRLKIKCDLRFPCSHCSKRGLAKICPDAELSQGSRRIKVLNAPEDLQRRIAALEQVVGCIQPDHPILRDSLPPHIAAQTTQVAHERRRLQRTADVQTPQADVEDAVIQPLSANSFASSAGISERQLSPETATHTRLIKGFSRGSTRYYGGAASSVYLSRRSIPGTDRATEPSRHALGQDVLNFSYPAGSPPSTHSLDQVLGSFLPPVEEARRLAELYFEVIGCFCSIVLAHNWEPNFLDKVYPNLEGQSPTARPQEAAVVFFVLAIGARVDTESANNESTANSLATAARLCLSLDTAHTLQLVRCLMLYGYYIMNGQQDTSLGDVYWPLLRMAMGIVEALGLHREDGSWEMDPDEKIERRIIFWECHGLDVMQSVNLGRGQCIASYAIDCPRIDVDGTGFHLGCFNLTTILSRINTVQIRVNPSPYTEVLDIDRELNDLEKSLPPHLAPQIAPSPFELADPAKRHLALKRNLLSMYINEARVSLHRSWFVKAIRDKSDEPLETDFRPSYLACLEASRNIVALVRNVIASHGRSVRVRWHYFFHLFSACVCLAAAVIHAPRSSLAAAALIELNTGVELFRFNQREELQTIMKRLRQHAERRMTAGGPTSLETEDSEDLELLGVRSRMIKPAVLTDLDVFFQQIPTPPNFATAGNGDFVFDFTDSQAEGSMADMQFSMDDLLGTNDGSQMQMVDDDVRALLSCFGLT